MSAQTGCLSVGNTFFASKNVEQSKHRPSPLFFFPSTSGAYKPAERSVPRAGLPQ